MLLAASAHLFWILLIHGESTRMDAALERFAVVGIVALSIAHLTPQSVQAPINDGLRALVYWAMH